MELRAAELFDLFKRMARHRVHRRADGKRREDFLDRKPHEIVFEDLRLELLKRFYDRRGKKKDIV